MCCLQAAASGFGETLPSANAQVQADATVDMYPPLMAGLATPRQQLIDAHEHNESEATVPTQLAAGSAVAAARGPCSGSHGRVLELALAEADTNQAGLAQLARRTSGRKVRPPGLLETEPLHFIATK